MDKNNFEERVDMAWCIDSETGEEILIDCKTWRIIAVKGKDGVIRDVDRKGLD